MPCVSLQGIVPVENRGSPHLTSAYGTAHSMCPTAVYSPDLHQEEDDFMNCSGSKGWGEVP